MSNILIIGTVPYSNNNQSRAFDTYFKNFDSKNLAQIFSSPQTPDFGHCDYLYQITDVTVLKNTFRIKKKAGIKYDFTINENNNIAASSEIIKKRRLISFLYRLGKNKNSINHLLRGFIWRKKNWLTEDLIKWVEDFKPDLVFIAFSDDFFILQIGLYFAEKYDIPIISAIGDDYYFNNKFSLNPLYHIYRRKYKKLVNKVMKYKGENIYISDKIKERYDSFFHKNGEVIYVSSDIKRLPFTPINKEQINFIYSGNLRLGRYRSILEISSALEEMSSKYIINIFSNEQSKKIIKRLKKCRNIKYCGYVKYEELITQLKKCDFSIIVEGKRSKDIDKTRYSLSTKVGDSIALGKPILIYGNEESGAIGFFKKNRCLLVANTPKLLTEKLSKFINNIELQKEEYERYELITKILFDKNENNKRFKNMVKKIITNYN